jgi:hypothetical protein
MLLFVPEMSTGCLGESLARKEGVSGFNPLRPAKKIRVVLERTNYPS